MNPHRAVLHFQVPKADGEHVSTPPPAVNGIGLPKSMIAALQGSPGSRWGLACGETIQSYESEGMTPAAMLVTCEACIASKAFAAARDRLNKANGVG